MSEGAVSRIELWGSRLYDSRDGSCLYQHRQGPVMVSVASLELFCRARTLCLPPARIHYRLSALEACHT
jgi:hypothetical protein